MGEPGEWALYGCDPKTEKTLGKVFFKLVYAGKLTI
jgi:hypothetical protein